MKTILATVFLAFVCVACKTETKKQNRTVVEATTIKKFESIERLNWLIGNWTNHTVAKQSCEKWRRENDSTLKAHSFTLVNGDTVFAEKVTLQQKGTDLYFTVVAYKQNDDEPVTFKMISAENGVFTFENADHDFPSRISYSNPVKDSIHAWIEGKVNGESKKVDFYFGKESRERS